MSGYRRRMLAGIVGAVLIATTLGFVASAILPSAPPPVTSIVTSVSTLTSIGVSTTTSLSSSSSQTTSGSASTITINCAGDGFCATSTSSEAIDYGEIANATLYSPAAQAYVRSAYSYQIIGISPEPSNSGLASVILNVTGSQAVAGNWTTGYTISYDENTLLNVTVQFTPPSTYEMTSVGVTTLIDHNESVMFSPEQKEVIQTALSSSVVRNLMGGSSYFVDSVTSVPITNGTYTGDYFTQLYELNGTKTVGVFVNGSATAVVSAYTDSRISTMCYGESDVCFTSPWNATA